MLDGKEETNQAAKVKKASTNGRSAAVDRSITHMLHRASQRASEIFGTETREFGITARQYAVMTAIAHNEGLSQTDLVQMTGIDRSTLADVVQRLLKRGLVQRERTSQDGRTYAVALSQSGHDLLEAIRPSARRADRLVQACLGEEEATIVAEVLNRLIQKTNGSGLADTTDVTATSKAVSSKNKS